MLVPKPVELVDKPPDGQAQYQELNAPATGEIYAGQIVRDNNGTATLVANTDTSGYLLALSDTSATLPTGGTAGGDIGNWVVRSQPAKVRVLPLAGRKAIVSVDGVLNQSHIGQRKTFKQSGAITVLDLSSAPLNGGATILELVEGAFGQPNARVLVQL